MKQKDLFVRGMLAAIAAALWVLILKPVLAPSLVRAAGPQKLRQIIVPAGGLEFVTPEGRKLADIQAGADSASLRLYGAKGHPTALLEGGESFSAVRLFNPEMKIVPDLNTGQGSGELWLRNENGNPIVQVWGHRQGGVVDVNSNEGKLLGRIQADQGGGSLALLNQDGDKAAALDVHGSTSEFRLHSDVSDSHALFLAYKHGAQCILSNRLQGERLVLRAAHRSADLWADNSEGNTVARLGTAGDGGGLVSTSDKDGEAIWEAPRK